MGDPRGRKRNDQTSARIIVVLTRNSTWRCGKLQKSIIRHLSKLDENLGKTGVSVKEIMLDLNITTCREKDHCLDALQRLQKRNVVKMTPP